ncbi:MAG: hypothetical protein HRT68_09760 [Flavobacteriaceae bacterium]|nr:hypothetical protein [Flavobacteriaceae bacterium]
MKLLISLFTVLAITFSCEDEEKKALELEEQRLNARIEQLKVDIVQLDYTVKNKEAEIILIEQKIDSLNALLLSN